MSYSLYSSIIGCYQLLLFAENYKIWKCLCNIVYVKNIRFDEKWFQICLISKFNHLDFHNVLYLSGCIIFHFLSVSFSNFWNWANPKSFATIQFIVTIKQQNLSAKPLQVDETAIIVRNINNVCKPVSLVYDDFR